MDARAQASIEALKRKLAAQGITPAAAEPDPAPRCPTCQDRGFVTLNVPMSDERYGKAQACPNPACPITRENRLHRAKRLQEKYGAALDENYANYTFHSWLALPADLREGKLLPLTCAYYFCEDPYRKWSIADALAHYEQPFTQQDNALIYRGATLNNSTGSWLCFEGDYGTGKTGLAVSIYNDLKDNGHFVVFVRLPDLIRQWQDTYNYTDELERRNAQESLSKPLLEADVLIVDEVNVAEDGKGEASPDKIRIFGDLIVIPRWSAATKKPTLFTTNKPQADFERHWGQRIAMRVFERAIWLKFNGTRLRQRNTAIGGI